MTPQRWRAVAAVGVVATALSVWGSGGHASAHAAPPTGPSLASVTPPPSARQGTLILERGTVPEGTTTVGAVANNFRPGDRVHFSWTLGAGSDGHADLGDAVAQEPAGAATVALRLPSGAAPGTYDVRAEGNGTRADAFLTVAPPSATPAPTTGPTESPRLTLPTDFTLGTGQGDGNGTTMHVAVVHFEKGMKVKITLQLLSGGGQHDVTPFADLGPTDAQGAAAGDVTLPPDMQAGAYDVEATEQGGAHATASASLTLRASAAKGLSSLDSGFFGGLWAHATEGLMLWWHGVTTRGEASLVGAIVGVTTVALDYTDKAFAFVFALSTPILLWGAGLLSVLIGCRILADVATMKVEGDGGHQAQHWALLIVEVAVLLGVAGGLKPIEHAVWAWTRGAPTGLGPLGVTGIGGFGAAIETWTTYRGTSLSDTAKWGMGEIASLCLLFVLTLQLILLTLGALAGWVHKLFLWLLGPLCVGTAATRQTRPLALWWTRSIISVSLWIIGWLVLFSIEGSAVNAVAKAAGIGVDPKEPKTWPNPLVAMSVGIVMMLFTNAVPAAFRKGVSLAIAGGGGIVDEMSGPVGVAWGWAKNKVPFLGRFG